MAAQRLIEGYARMWPRELLNIRIMIGGKAKPHPDIKAALQYPGVYVLYQDANPYYVGKTWNLFRRLWRHANNPRSEYFNFWNFFSFYVIKTSAYQRAIEGLLITSMPTANRSNPGIPRITIPIGAWKILKRARRLIDDSTPQVEDEEA